MLAALLTLLIIVVSAHRLPFNTSGGRKQGVVNLHL